MLKLIVKSKVFGSKASQKRANSSANCCKRRENFADEKKRLGDYIQKTQELGESHFDGWESHHDNM